MGYNSDNDDENHNVVLNNTFDENNNQSFIKSEAGFDSFGSDEEDESIENVWNMNVADTYDEMSNSQEWDSNDDDD
eukprot:13230116-Ditylum_brightwellii.AAC.1